MSLRQVKKQKTTKTILIAARSQFEKKGIDATTMEDIAAAAEVSVGTLYNYFGSKQTLFIALFEDEIRRMLEAGSAAIAEHPGPVASVRRLFDAYLDVMLTTSRELLRQVLRYSFGGEETIDELVKLDESLMAQLAIVLATEQQAGSIGADVDIADAVFVLYSTLITELMLYLAIEGVDRDTVHRNVARRVALVFTGFDTRS